MGGRELIWKEKRELLENEESVSFAKDLRKI